MTIEGVAVLAILPGVVASASGDRLPYGNMVIIETQGEYFSDEVKGQLGLDDGESLYHLYAHMQDTPEVMPGMRIACGEPLGLVGLTGYNIVEPHLHLETRIGPSGHQFLPMAYYDTSATQSEMDEYRLWRTSGLFQHFDPMILFDIFRDMNE